MPGAVSYRAMVPEDYQQVYALWCSVSGMGLDPELDSAAGVSAYLNKNPGLSFVACDSGGKVISTVLSGTDGRRGYLMHLAVADNYRRQGLGRKLVDLAVAALREIGISRVHVFVFKDNTAGADFWRGLGWQGRDDLLMLSFEESGAASE